MKKGLKPKHVIIGVVIAIFASFLIAQCENMRDENKATIEASK